MLLPFLAMGPAHAQAGIDRAKRGQVFETSFASTEDYEHPFMEVQVDVVFSNRGRDWQQPAFWKGGKTWAVRVAFPETGVFIYRVNSKSWNIADIDQC